MKELFELAHGISDLALPVHERIAVFRLLLCICQAALDGPEYDNEIAPSRDDLAGKVIAYLEKWRHEFELLGDGPRFLQIRSGKTAETSVAKLDLTLASGNSATLLDHGALSPRVMSPQRLALSLVTFLNFSPLIGRGYKGRGPAVENNMRHTYLQGETLLDTLVRNLLSHATLSDRWSGDGMGRPVWENPPSLSQPDSPAGRNATRTYLGRLCPLSRSVWILDGEWMILDNGFDFPGPEEILEPSGASVLIKPTKTTEKLIILSTRTDRSVWRDLDALLAARPNTTGKAPLYLANARLFPKEERHAVWTGGLVTDYQAKIEDSASALFSGDRGIPAEWLDGRQVDAMDRYRDAVRAAGDWASAMTKATAEYSNGIGRGDDAFRATALADFWARLEQRIPMLFEFVRNPLLAVSTLPETQGFSYSSANPYNPSPWHLLAKRTAHDCYQRACLPDGGRHMMAFVRGESQLWPVNPQKSQIAAHKKALAHRLPT